MNTTAIVYYSYGNNTDQIARRIQKSLDADLIRLETTVPYSSDYNTVVKQGKKEIDSGFEPDLKPYTFDPSQYNTVFIGTPVWWYTMAPAMRTFLQSAALTGKTIIPFATNGGGAGHTLHDIAVLCPDAAVAHGKTIRFNDSTLAVPDTELDRWIKEIKENL